MPELIPSFGGPEQVGGDRRVKLEAGRLDALGEQRAHQRLGVVSTEAHGARLPATSSSVRCSAGIHSTSAVSGADDGELGDR